MTRNDDKPEEPKPEEPMQQKARARNAAPGSGLTREATIKIGQQLRAMYDEVVKEGVPDRFNDLLKRLEGGEGNGEGSRS